MFKTLLPPTHVDTQITNPYAHVSNEANVVFSINIDIHFQQQYVLLSQRGHHNPSSMPYLYIQILNVLPIRSFT